MEDIEFQAKVENGVIVIPDEHKSDLAEVEQVKITLRKPIKPPFFKDQFILQLLKNPVPVPGIRQITREEMHER
jgi:hypothetical protein